MTAIAGWLGPLLVWSTVTWAARRLMIRFGLVRCSAGDWGTAFLLGFTFHTVLVFLASLTGIPIGAPLMVAAAGGIAALGFAGGYGRSLPRAPLPRWTPAEFVVLGALAVYGVLVVVNALYLPVSAMDAHSYDGRAQFLIVDGSLDLAMYHWPGLEWSGRTNITYPPLFSLGLSVTYAFGGWQSKIVTALFSLAWVLIVYGVLRQHLPRFWALVWTLLLAVTPEVLSHASWALLNVPAMALLLVEVVAWSRFVEERRPAWLLMAGTAAAGAAGVRPDAVALHLAVAATAALFVLTDRARRRGLGRLAVPVAGAVAAPLATWGVWTLYLRLGIGMQTVAPLASEEPWGPVVIARYLGLLMAHTATYGPVFLVWLVSVPFTIAVGRRRGEPLFYTVAAAALLAGLVLIFGSLDRSFAGGLSELVNSSLKRALFYAIPVAGIAAALAPPSRWLAGVGRGWLHDGPPAARPR